MVGRLAEPLLKMIQRLAGVRKPVKFQPRERRPVCFPFERNQSVPDFLEAREAERFTWKGGEQKKPFRILSLDGGGFRGILSCILLRRIENEINQPLLKHVDLIVGTSTGGMLALMLASGYSPLHCERIYEYASPLIFERSLFGNVNWFAAKYPSSPRKEVLEFYLGERTLMDLTHPVAITAFRCDGRKLDKHTFFNGQHWRPAIFSNMPKGDSLVRPDSHLLASQVGLRTSAAPTFFKQEEGYIDGAMLGNDPSLLGVSKALATYSCLSPSDIRLLSIGTGVSHHQVHFQDSSVPLTKGREPGDWGILQWSRHLLDLSMEAPSFSLELITHNLLNNHNDRHYHKINPQLPSEMALDDVSKISELMEFGHHQVDVQETVKFVKSQFIDI